MTQVTKKEDWRRGITFEEFKKLVNSPGWERSQKVEVVDRFPVERWKASLKGYVYVTHVIGWAATFNYFDDVEVYYVEDWAYDENTPDSFTTKPQGWIVDGVKIVHDNGDEVTTFDIADALPKVFTTIDYSELNI